MAHRSVRRNKQKRAICCADVVRPLCIGVEEYSCVENGSVKTDCNKLARSMARMRDLEGLFVGQQWEGSTCRRCCGLWHERVNAD